MSEPDTLCLFAVIEALAVTLFAYLWGRAEGREQGHAAGAAWADAVHADERRMLADIIEDVREQRDEWKSEAMQWREHDGQEQE